MSATATVSDPCAGPAVLRPAAPWRRLAARVVDLATVLFVQWALTVISVFFFVPVLVERVHPEPWGRAFVPTVLFVTLLGLYEAVFTTRNEGRTPGKDLFHIKVVTRGRAVHPPLPVAVLRWAPVGAALMLDPLWLGLLAVLACGLPMCASSGRSVFDLVASTQVVVDPSVEEASP